MKRRSKLTALLAFVALSASADKAHEVFEANKEAILAQPIRVCGEVAFSVGRAQSPRSRGDAVGYAKADAEAKWNLGEQHHASAPWPDGTLEEEKDDAWREYRSQHMNRYSVFGMQRIFSRKSAQDSYLVVLAFPAEQVNVPAPTQQELAQAVGVVRERRRRQEESARKADEESQARICATNSCTVEKSSGMMNGGAVVDSKVLEGALRRDADDADKAAKKVYHQSGLIKRHETLDEDMML